MFIIIWGAAVRKVSSWRSDSNLRGEVQIPIRVTSFSVQLTTYCSGSLIWFGLITIHTSYGDKLAKDKAPTGL